MEYLVTMPLRVWRCDEVTELAHHPPMAPWLTEEITPLVPHPSDPAVSGSRPAVAQARR
jgi:muconolactone delta-isomerase